MVAAKFRMLASTVVICGLMMVCPLDAQSGKTQAQQLVDSTVKKNGDLAGLEVSATPAGKTTCVTIAATEAKDIGEKCDEDEFAALKAGKPHVERIGRLRRHCTSTRCEWQAGWNHWYRFQVAAGSDGRIHSPAHR